MPTLLVVDDTQLDRVMISGVLRKRPGVRVELAANGGEALAILDRGEPHIDMVVTDLHMPGINGLELVTALRLKRPETPVVLITAKGSEALAMRALEQGAASYVPKSQLAERLADTVGEVLALANSQRNQARLVASLTEAHLKFRVESDEELFSPLVDMAQQTAAHVGLCDAGGQIRLGMALTEALRAALYHGNFELTAAQVQESRRQGAAGLAAQRADQSPYRDRKLFVEMDLSASEGRFEIIHQGPSFSEAIGVRGEPPTLEQAASRALVLMRSLMDEARFSDDGRRIVLLKRSPAPLVKDLAEGVAEGVSAARPMKEVTA